MCYILSFICHISPRKHERGIAFGFGQLGSHLGSISCAVFAATVSNQHVLGFEGSAPLQVISHCIYDGFPLYKGFPFIRDFLV